MYLNKTTKMGKIKAIYFSTKIFQSNNRIRTCIVKEHEEICMLITFPLYNENITIKEIHS